MIITREIKEEYAKKRALALAASEERKRAVFALVPRLEQIEALRRELIFDMGLKLRLADDKGAVRKEVMEHIAILDAEQTELFKQYGITEEYLAPQFECAQCNDTGFVGEFEKQMCKCLKQRLLEQQYATSHISGAESFETFNLDIFKKPRQRQLMEAVKMQMEEYCDSFPNNDKNDILLMGDAGLGKTFLLNCIAKRLSDKGFGVLKLTSYNLINNVLKSMRGEPFDFISPDLLIIDDLGTEPMIPNVTREHLFATVNERQNAHKPTVIATNLLPEELQEAYGERLFSRIVAPRMTKIIKLTGDNVRIAVK
ncbi:MAG: ATP-binding protein [Clostridia bacterium]|nr:ATP-binding protein [Clostridia bacterium]